MIYKFSDGCELHVKTRKFIVDGKDTNLTPKPFNLLIHLIENRDRLVAKDELLEMIWGEDSVTESSITSAIREIRRRIKKPGRKDIFQPVWGVGYQFVADVDVEPENPTNSIGEELLGGDRLRQLIQDQFTPIAKQLGIAESAANNFFSILLRENIPSEQWDTTFREIAKKYKALEADLQAFKSDDPQVTVLKEHALQALQEFAYERADDFLDKAMGIDGAAFTQQREAFNKRGHSFAAVCAQRGDIQIIQLKYTKAADYFRQAADALENIPDRNENLLAKYLRSWGIASFAAGDFRNAERPFEHAVTICEKALGSEHPITAANLNELATLYRHQGRFSEAEPLFKRALEIYQKSSDQEDLDTAMNLNNLAILYRHQGRFSEAEPLFKRALEICKKEFGQEHITIAAPLNNLATLYRHQGRFSEAEPLFKRALEICKKEFGQEHPNTAQSLNNLADIYQKQGRYGEAEPLLKQALGVREKILGSDHPNIAESLNNLAAFYFLQGKENNLKEIETLFKRAIEIYEKVLGLEHMNTARAYNNLAVFYQKQSRHREAESLFEQVLAINGKVLGHTHPDTILIRKVLSHRPTRSNDHISATQTSAQPQRNRHKLGRNAPCWCGSGKKYKRCHLNLENG